MKIVMIGHKRIPSREGGVEIVVEELSKRIVQKGHEVIVYNRMGHHVSGKGYDSKRGKIYKGIKIRQIPTFKAKFLNALIYSVIAAFRVLFEKCDCVHFHAEGSCAMLWLPHLFGKKCVVTIHGLDWQRSKWGGFATKYIKFGEKIAVKFADEIIVLSENVQNYFIRTYNRKTIFIPNGIEAQKGKENIIIKERWELEKYGYYLFLGRIVPEKGVHYLIEAYKKLDTGRKLVIAGGSSHTSDYVKDIKVLASDYTNIIFTDFVEGDVLEELYSNAYAYILPSDLEGMPISLLEAMSYGNCCLVSDIPECTEVVEEYALTFEKGNIDDLLNKLEYMENNQESVKTYRDKSAKYICNKYNWDDVADRTIELYRGKN